MSREANLSLISPLVGYARIRHLLATLLHPPRSVDPVQAEPPAATGGPAHRLRAATWMNGRTALGAGLVLLAVLAGATFLDRSQRLVPVYAATRDLPAGTSLQDRDLVVIRPDCRPGRCGTTCGPASTVRCPARS
jgi:hypothetical protein